MPAVVLKSTGTAPFGALGRATEFLDLFVEKAGFVKEHHWEARLEKTARCDWDSPPVRVVGYKHRFIYLRVKPSLNATVDHFVRLLIPDGAGYTAKAASKRLRLLVKPFHHFVRTNGRRKKESAPPTGAASALSQFHQKARELADARQRMEVNRQKYRALQGEIKALDDEYQEITQQLLTLSVSVHGSGVTSVQRGQGRGDGRAWRAL